MDRANLSSCLAPFAELPPSQRWPRSLAALEAQRPTVAQRLALHEACLSDWDTGSQGPRPIWFPAQQRRRSNLADWMERLGISGYHEFHRWSVTQRAEFWSQACQRLGILFRSPAEQVLDVSQGVERAAWFAGARLNIVDSCFQGAPQSPAIVCQRPGAALEYWTVAELQERSAQVANSLVDAGFRVGDAIGVLMPMTGWSVAIYLGILMAGCHAVSIADSFAPPEIATRLRISGAKAVVTYDVQCRLGKTLPLYRTLAEAAEVPAIVLSWGEVLEVDLRDQDRSWDEFLVSRTHFVPVAAEVQETINVLFSSGTTGDPKAIPWNQLTPIKCAVDGHCHQDIQPGDVCAWPTNLGWMMGPWLIFASLINRATIALYEDAPLGAGFGKFVQDAGVTMLGVVPTIVKAWQTSGEMETCDWSAIEVFSSTGESSQPGPMTYLSALAGFRPIIEYCGGTEIGGGYVSSVVELPNVPAAFNTSAVGLDFVLVEEGTPPQLADKGEVFLLPPSIGLSQRLINRDHHETYFAQAPEFPDLGTLRRHGDYFRRLPGSAGPLYVAGGRVDDTMNLGGIKISSAELERVLNRLPGIRETAAVAQSQADGPDALIVYAVLDADGDAEADWPRVMNGQLRTELNPLFRVQAVEIVEQLPRTASGKVMRRLLRRQTAAEGDSA